MQGWQEGEGPLDTDKTPLRCRGQAVTESGDNPTLERGPERGLALARTPVRLILQSHMGQQGSCHAPDVKVNLSSQMGPALLG